jgi:hypothetical protein
MGNDAILMLEVRLIVFSENIPFIMESIRLNFWAELSTTIEKGLIKNRSTNLLGLRAVPYFLEAMMFKAA